MEAMPKPVAPLGYEDPPLCAACGGKCCKAFPGAVFPEEHPSSLADWLVAALRSGEYVVEPGFSEERSHVWFIAPARVATPVGRICVFLTAKGCKLSFDDRPTGCRLLLPKPGGDCHPAELGEVAAIEAWLPYHSVIRRAAKASGRV